MRTFSSLGKGFFMNDRAKKREACRVCLYFGHPYDMCYLALVMKYNEACHLASFLYSFKYHLFGDFHK